MATKTIITDYYAVEVTFKMTERNTYGDVLSDNVIHATYKVKVNGPTGLAYLLAQINATMDNVREVMR